MDLLYAVSSSLPTTTSGSTWVPLSTDLIVLVVIGFVLAFALAFGLGANDVASSFGTSVGSKVLTLRQACVLATIFETAGAMLIGGKVTDTIRSKVVYPETWNNSMEIKLLADISALGGGTVWLISATALKLPVSTSHSIVGAILGASLVAKGGDILLNVRTLIFVGISWLSSPILAGLVSSLIFILIKFTVLNKVERLEPGLRLLPIFYGFTLFVNVLSIMLSVPELFDWDIQFWLALVISLGPGFLVAGLTYFILVPYQRRQVQRELKAAVEAGIENKGGEFESGEINGGKDGQISTISNGHAVEMDVIPVEQKTGAQPEKDVPTFKQDPNDPIADTPDVTILFSKLQILTAIFGGFAHGANDVSNAIGPIASLWVIATTRDVMSTEGTPWWLLLYGGAGICLGLWIWGRRVIETLGENLTRITPTSGFSIELGSALTVLVASNLQMPVSSTHCKVGSVVAVGRVRSKESVDWSLFKNIVLSWIVTVPCTGLISAALMGLFMWLAVY